MNAVAPLLSEERADEVGGLWATKQYGDFKEGDRLWAADYVTGSFEVRQLRSVYKLSFLDITRVNRFRLDGEGGEPRRDDVTDDASNESLAIARKAEREKSTVRLRVYLTKKKAKARMGDLEETAFLLRLDAGTEGCICYGNSFGDFDQGMLQVPDPTGYKGIVIAKQRADHPATDEPVVYAFAKIAHRRRPVVSTEVVLGLAEEKDRATRYTKATRTVKTDEHLLKGVRKYTRTARKAWEALSIPEDQEIDIEDFKRAFDELNLVILESRAIRLFKCCDLDRSGKIGITELEVALMINEIVPTMSYLTPLDSFYTFDLDAGGDICWVEFKEAAQVIGGGTISEEEARKLFDKADADKSGAIDYKEFKQVWMEMVDVEKELKLRELKPAFGPMSGLRNRRQLHSAVETEDEVILEAFQTARERVDGVRKRARLLRDEKKRLKASGGGKSTLDGE
ncbi:unnamed protein product [Sphacelaria rigidula]